MTKAKRKNQVLPLPVPTEQEKLLGWVYLAIEMLVLPSAITLLGENFGGFDAGVTNFIYYLTNAVACVLIFREALGCSLLRAGERFGRLLGTALVCFLMLLGANQLVSAAARVLIPSFLNANDAAVTAMVMCHPFLMAVGLILLVPVAEECLFRGLLFGGFYQKNRMGAYLLSVVCFAMVHVVGYIGSADPLTLFVCFLQYVPPGIILAYSYEKTGSLYAPMLIHGAVNAGSLLALR